MRINTNNTDMNTLMLMLPAPMLPAPTPTTTDTQETVAWPAMFRLIGNMQIAEELGRNEIAESYGECIAAWLERL